MRLTFEDKGPGIADMKLALTDGYTTGGGLGLASHATMRYGTAEMAAGEKNSASLPLRNRQAPSGQSAAPIASLKC